MATGKARRIPIGTAGLCVAFLGAALVVFSHSGRPIRNWFRQDRSLPILWEVPAFSAVDQFGHPTTEQSLRGHVWIAAFIFTRCTTVCPRISNRMAQVRSALPAADVRFVSFSVDPDFDSPAALWEYARRWNADTRWLLLNAGTEGVRTLARGMRAAFEPVPDPVNPVVHSSSFSLVDRNLSVRGVYDSGDEAALRRLVLDAAMLEAPTAPAPAIDIGAAATADAGTAPRHDRQTAQNDVVDPVCGMSLSASADNPRAQYGGTWYFFCSERCREEFMNDPRRYLPRH
ncbi:MAG: SCO family protein [Candidatus Binatia bacterium]